MSRSRSAAFGVALAAASAMAARPASAQIIYQSNFGSGLSGFTTTGGGGIRTDNGVTYLGNLTQGATTSQTFNTAGYTNVRLSFTLYAVLSVDGNGQLGGGADPFLVGDNGGTIFNYTFANFTGSNTQSYGGGGAGSAPGSFAPRTGASAGGQLGFGLGDFGDATYLFSNLLLTPDGGGQLTLTFTGNSNQSAGDEFYGINNVVITGDLVPSAVPEPGTWALLGTGLAGLGVVARRRATAR